MIKLPKFEYDSTYGLVTIDGNRIDSITDVAKMLGYANPQKAIRDHCKGVNEMVTPTKGGNRRKNI